MKRQDLIRSTAIAAQITQAEANHILHHLEAQIIHALTTTGEYHLQGIGIIKVKTRTARTGRNPKTGATLQIAASQTLSITPAKAIKEALNP